MKFILYLLTAAALFAQTSKPKSLVFGETTTASGTDNTLNLWKPEPEAIKFSCSDDGQELICRSIEWPAGSQPKYKSDVRIPNRALVDALREYFNKSHPLTQFTSADVAKRLHDLADATHKATIDVPSPVTASGPAPAPRAVEMPYYGPPSKLDGVEFAPSGTSTNSTTFVLNFNVENATLKVSINRLNAKTIQITIGDSN